MSHEQQAFLDQILADPDNDEPRLVYADWLSDRGDPRGEFIQLQCARERLPEFSAEAFAIRQRELELLRQHKVEWAGELEDLLYRYEFRRGFVEWGRVNTDRFVKTASQLFRLTPLQHVMFARGTVDDKLARCAGLRNLKSICFSKCQAAPSDLLAILESPHTVNVRGLGFADWDSVPLRHISDTKPELESLYANQTNMRGWNAWLNKAELPPLRCLRVKGGHLHEQIPDAFRHVCDSPLPATLEEFGFCEWDSRAADIVRFNDWPRLRKLEISMPTAAAVMKLGESPVRIAALSIESYTHRGIGLPPHRFRQLLEAPMLSKLSLLRVHGTVSDDYAIELAKWPRLPELCRLNLSSNSMTAEGIRLLLHALPQERRGACDFRSSRAGDEGIRQILEEFGAHLKRCLAGSAGWYLGDTQGRDWSGENLTIA